MLAACLLCWGSSSSRERECFFCLFVCFQTISCVITFFVSQAFEVGDVDRALGEQKEFISTEKGYHVSSFKIPEYFSITFLFLVLFFFFNFSLREKTHLFFFQLHLMDPFFYVQKALQKTISLGIYETHKSISCSTWILVWQVVHAV